MKIAAIFSVSLVTLAACLVSVGCEMHPPSQTIPGYAEKETAKQTVEKQKSLIPEEANTNAPTYFPGEKR